MYAQATLPVGICTYFVLSGAAGLFPLRVLYYALARVRLQRASGRLNGAYPSAMMGVGKEAWSEGGCAGGSDGLWFRCERRLRDVLIGAVEAVSGGMAFCYAIVGSWLLKNMP